MLRVARRAFRHVGSGHDRAGARDNRRRSSLALLAPMQNKPIYEALAEAFAAEGADTHFTLMGDGNMRARCPIAGRGVMRSGAQKEVEEMPPCVRAARQTCTAKERRAPLQ